MIHLFINKIFSECNQLITIGEIPFRNLLNDHYKCTHYISFTDIDVKLFEQPTIIFASGINKKMLLIDINKWCDTQKDVDLSLKRKVSEWFQENIDDTYDIVEELYPNYL